MEPFDFVNRANAEYIDQLYQQYQRDPRSLDPAWLAFFAGFEAGYARTPRQPVASSGAASLKSSDGNGSPAPADDSQTGDFTTGIYDLVHSYRELGHFIAHLDPLGHDRPSHPLLELSEFGLSTEDFNRRVVTGGFAGAFDGTLRDLIEKLRLTYCRTFGVEFLDIPDKAQRDWLIHKIEPIYNKPQFTRDEQCGILQQLIAAEEFERFLGTRFVGQKRFSLEGAEALIPLLNQLIDGGSPLGVEEVVLGMAHRGRLNVLAHVLNKPYEVILSEFEGTIKTEDSEGDGDVKYHLGYTNERPMPKGGKVHLLLCPNPSHLELVNPVMQGIVRSKQTYLKDHARNRVVPITIHGEAAFTGQGIVPETLGLSELPGYRTGGTIHVIVNNQVGFTASPKQTRFTPYATDVARMIQAPIFHVNGDDPEAVVWAAKLAIGFREQFKVDVMIDLWCYRKHGHNETDEASFTQPVMYREIGGHKSTRQLYAERLIAQGIVTEAEVEQMKQGVLGRLNNAAALAKEHRPRQRNVSLGPIWKGMTRATHLSDWSAKTSVTRDVLKHIATATSTLPADFTVHPKLTKLVQGRKQMVETGKGIDWGCAEMLAVGSLLMEGHAVRITGQDVERGTFSHRHDILNDFKDGKRYVPLAHLTHDQAHITITNTMLSELAVLGFEFGFTIADPKSLVIWEAQFGDFVNGAQPIIDQFVVAAESKWQLMSGLTINLPHGYEGQGPEHSSAYLERFLALCAEDNIQIVVPTTSGNYFHALRRQICRRFRKPLVNFMPKSLLRFEPSSSTIEELTEGAFHLVIDDPAGLDRNEVRRLLLCTGKVYYTLKAAIEKSGGRGDVAVVRVEQLYPFPQKELQAVIAKYRRVEEVGWVQEEPQNRGAWTFMEPRLRQMLPDTAVVLNYHGREAAASPATGSYKMHQIEEQEFVAHALDVAPQDVPRKGPTTAKQQTAVDG
ncbi:MAG: 2-oxoglutarate dehydrogenase E1 component [Chthoniobacterales bacterium]|nr:2-oxoglutarate dehydrogenase E1 component [Chthoniobacterales bacterium]